MIFAVLLVVSNFFYLVDEAVGAKCNITTDYGFTVKTVGGR